MSLLELLNELCWWLEQPNATIDDIRQFTNEIYEARKAAQSSGEKE